MPLFEAPPSAMPTGRIPTPAEFVAEAVRRGTWEPRSAGIAAMVEQIVLSVGDAGSADPDELTGHLRMGALLALIVDERFDEITADEEDQ
jgi:hypothetical protein